MISGDIKKLIENKSNVPMDKYVKIIEKELAD